MASPSSKIFAVIVGIDQYRNTDLPHLNRAVSDAKKLAQLLIQDLQVPENHVLQLYDDEATRSGIINAIANFPENSEFEPGNALLFFFSGLAGRAGSNVGMICPVDINTESQTGISDSTLIRLFDQISRSYGNNITLLLDCDSDLFHWKDSGSFVVISPEDATETEGGGSFTESLVDVLKLEKKNNAIQILTVQSFVAKVGANIISSKSSESTVKCFGRNTDHLLFDRANGGAYYPFIRGQAEIGKDIILRAGLAHGIVPETKLAIFYSNVSDSQNKKVKLLGDVVVQSAGNTTSILRRFSGSGAPPFPSIFYAIETHYPRSEVGKIVKILIKGDPAGYPDPFTICGAKKADQTDEANLILRFNDDDEPSLWWNGPTNVHDRQDKCRISLPSSFFSLFRGERKGQRFMKKLRKATRFAYHLLRVSPGDSPSSPSVYLQLRNTGDSETMNTDRKELKGDLLGAGRVELEVKKGETLGPFLLDVVNKSRRDLWLHVFLFDPSTLVISPLYPTSAGDCQLLKAGKKGSFGSRNSNGLLFKCPTKTKKDVSYIKVFATTQPTDFSFLEQRFQFISTTEDQLREVGVDPPAGPNLPCLPLDEEPGNVMFGGLANWTTAMLTIVRTLSES